LLARCAPGGGVLTDAPVCTDTTGCWLASGVFCFIDITHAMHTPSMTIPKIPPKIPPIVPPMLGLPFEELPRASSDEGGGAPSEPVEPATVTFCGAETDEMSGSM